MRVTYKSLCSLCTLCVLCGKKYPKPQSTQKNTTQERKDKYIGWYNLIVTKSNLYEMDHP